MDYADLYAALANTPMAPSLDEFRDIVEHWVHERPHGDMARWHAALERIQAFPSDPAMNLQDAFLRAPAAPPGGVDQMALKDALLGLKPWRKGPFNIHGIQIETEWRSDWKWARLQDHIADLSGRRVLDIGCGSGYHCWRMAGAGADFVLGIDPGKLFVMQYFALRHFLPRAPVWVVPLRLEHLPEAMVDFDTIFSMGILYHRKSPIEHIDDIGRRLRAGGEMVLETLVIPGDERQCLMPKDRYAMMRNVWFIPSSAMLRCWVERAGFEDVRLVSECATTPDEQKSSEWMPFNSLSDFLDPTDPERTVEGLPAPRRAVLVARKPG